MHLLRHAFPASAGAAGVNAAVHIVGIGSYQAGDSVGWLAVQTMQAGRFAERFPVGSVELRCYAAPVLAVGELAGCERARGVAYRPGQVRRLAVFVDALSGARGRVRRLRAQDLAGGAVPASVHGVSLGEAVALGRALDPGFPEVVVFGIGVGHDLSGVVRGAERFGLDAVLSSLTACVAAEVDGFLRRCRG